MKLKNYQMDTIKVLTELLPPKISSNSHIQRFTNIKFSLEKFNKRLVFDILDQAVDTIWVGEDTGPNSGFKFVASNGYELISRSRMDIQTERLWLLGKSDLVSGCMVYPTSSATMVFSDNTKRDDAYEQFIKAISEWDNFISLNSCWASRNLH